jgi:hypothetical protein
VYQPLFILYPSKLAFFCCYFYQLTVSCHRICSLGYIVTSTVFKSEPKVSITVLLRAKRAFIINVLILFLVAPINTCYTVEKISSVFFLLCVPSTSLLFFFRTRAVFDKNPWVVSFFLGLWLAVVATCVLVTVGVDETNIPGTKYCIDGRVKSYVTIATILPVTNDTLVFLAITWRLYRNSYARPTLRHNLQVLIFGHYLPRFSRAMLHDGQAYYLLVPLSPKSMSRVL